MMHSEHDALFTGDNFIPFNHFVRKVREKQSFAFLTKKKVDVIQFKDATPIHKLVKNIALIFQPPKTQLQRWGL